jgi:hypothetical protein
MKLINRRKKAMNDIQEPERKLMSLREIDALPDNPFIIRKDRYIDPNDPSLSLDEKKRLRRNWNKRRNYKRKKDLTKQKKEKDEAIKILQQVVEKAVNKKEKQKKEKDGFYNE